ncbi:hypothetical protein XGA_1102 [Xanthomonas hortorum ATCC 19865]|nr:hypothetical protein XGA_1102 [Xanthomonas hortorum ATCC 19865]
MEYDEDTNLKTVYLENTSRQFDRTHTEGTLAYVDRCTAFEDGSADGDWCALVVDRQQSMKLCGIAVDAPLDASQQGPRPRVRQPIMLTQTARKTEAGRYNAKRRPTRAFWVEAVSSERKVVLAQQWVVPDAAGRIRMPVGLEHAVEDLEIRAWLDYTDLSQTAPELRRCTGIRRAPLLLGAAAQRWLLGAACTTRTCRF